MKSFNENALARESMKAGLMVRRQIAITIKYDGDYVADLLVKTARLVEIKAVRALDPEPRRSMSEFLFGRPDFWRPC